MNVTIVCPSCATLNRVPEARLGAAPHCGACKALLFTGAPLDVDEAGLERHVAQDGVPVLVDVWAAWCGPCRAMAPQFAAAARMLEPKIRLLKLDADRAPQTMARHGINSIPTLLLFKSGRLAARQAGAMSASQLAAWVSQQLTH